MRTRQCKRCGGPAVAVQGPGSRPLCMDCIDPEGPPVEYICSVAGCGNQPVILAVMDDVEAVSVIVCGSHFEGIRDRVVSHVDLPAWLTDGDAYIVSNGDVVFHIDLSPETSEEGEGYDGRRWAGRAR